MNAQVIAYYLPQFHPTPENDVWWGKGFTEWTNVAKAKPLYWGHEQPKIPADLGFYDLRLPEVREAQAELAKEAGISAFCYWHYWFGNKRKMLNMPFEEVVRTKEPDFPFCLAWANHSWYNKSWTAKSGSFSIKNSTLLVEQTYPGEQDYIDHFYDLLPAFKDNRYYRIHDRLLFVIFDPIKFTDFPHFKQTWNALAEKEGLPSFYFIAHIFQDFQKMNDLTEYDGINLSLHHIPFQFSANKSWINKQVKRITNHISLIPHIVSYKKAILSMDSSLFEKNNVYPTLIPNWDHTPRSGRFGRVMHGSTPTLFKKHIGMVLNRIKNKPVEDQIIFLKSWNEWGEGNYMEPDLKYGKGYIEALGKIIKQ